MGKGATAVLFALTSVVAAALPAAQREPQPSATGDQSTPSWAFPANPPGVRPAPDDGRPRRVVGSTEAFTLTHIRDLFNPPDWHPDDHPPMPEVVGRGRKPAVYACGYCHLPNGLGRPENANLAGLPAAYIKQQLVDFKSETRVSSVPTLLPQALMSGVAKMVTEAEAESAAAYFAALRPGPWIRVVETDTVPKTHVEGWMLVPVTTGETEPIGQRIIETAEDLERTELRDARSGFVAYVPVGSIDRGEAFVRSGGGGRTVACGTCHGADLKGLGPVPGLAGRSPSYVVRQLYDFKHGVRNGLWADLMDAAVANLTLEDFVEIAAYTASLTP